MNTKSTAQPQRRRGIVRRLVTPFVDVRSWMGYDQLKETTRNLYGTIKKLFIPEKTDQIETFDEAIRRMNMSEEDIQNRIRVFTFLAIFWFIVSLAIIFYGVYLAGQRSWFGFIACLGLSLIMLSQAFYYHFWMFQMKQRRLGCTFKDWWDANFTGGGA